MVVQVEGKLLISRYVGANSIIIVTSFCSLMELVLGFRAPNDNKAKVVVRRFSVPAGIYDCFFVHGRLALIAYSL